MLLNITFILRLLFKFLNQYLYLVIVKNVCISTKEGCFGPQYLHAHLSDVPQRAWRVDGRILLYGPIPDACLFRQLEYHVRILTARVGYLYLDAVSLLHTLQEFYRLFYLFLHLFV